MLSVVNKGGIVEAIEHLEVECSRYEDQRRYSVTPVVDINGKMKGHTMIHEEEELKIFHADLEKKD